MKKLTLSALAAVAVVGTAFAGPCPVESKEFKQPCATPCFRDQEFQIDLFYSYNDAQHVDPREGDRTFTQPTAITPVPPNSVRASNLINNPALVPSGTTVDTTSVAGLRNLGQFFNDGSGGGVGLNYFFTRYVGVGVEGNWWKGIRDNQDNFNSGFAIRDVLDGPAMVGAATTVAANLRAAGENAVAVDPNTVVVTRSRVTNRTKDRSIANQVTGSLILRYPFEGPICWAPYIFGGGGGVFDNDSVGFGHIGLGVEFRVTPYMGFFADWRWEFMSRTRNDDNNRDFARTVGINTVDFNGNDKRQDVNMTRVGIRFAF